MTLHSLETFCEQDVTEDDFLGGAVKLLQPREGYRVSMDTVMLAAAIPAEPSETVLEGGVGTGGAAVCLARRVSGLRVVGLDKQPAMLAFAQKNADRNGLSEFIELREACVTDLTGNQSTFDHVMLNPPYLPRGKGLRPPAESKGIAHMDTNATLKDWVRFAVHYCRQKGSITMIIRADRVDEVIAHMYGRVGDLMIMPLWPREGVPAKRVIIQGRKGAQGPATILPGIALHGEVERYTDVAKKILWDGEGLSLKGFAYGGQSE